MPWSRLGTAAVLLTALVPASAQTVLSDPMKPGTTAPAPVAPGVPPSGASAGVSGVLLSSTRSVAVIDGRVIAPGQEARDGRLMRVTPTGVVIRNDAGTTVLPLFPGIEKRPSKP